MTPLPRPNGSKKRCAASTRCICARWLISTTVETDQYESGTVADEVQRGYRWGDEVLRPARVRVAE